MAVYATGTDLGRLSAFNAAQVAELPALAVDSALSAASADADGYLAARFALPLVAWGDDLRQRVCDVAAYRLAGNQGYAPEGSAEELRARYEDAVRWFEQVARGLVQPSVVTVSPAPADAPAVETTTPRGW